jgi:two-component system, chemotaxis family, response regulator Rcp1
MVVTSEQGGKVVLLVEDDDGAYFLLKVVFREMEERVSLFRVSNGEQAIAFLQRKGEYHAAPRPALILLNLQMPKMTGFDLLASMRQDPQFRDIPAVVFTSSKLDADRAKCMALGATDFISKPENYADVVSAIKIACAHA